MRVFIRVFGACITATLSVSPSSLAAQLATGKVPRVDYYFYHGSREVQLSSPIEFGGNRFRFAGQRHIQLRRPPGTEVCVNIPDANPANYVYGLAVSVDTTKPKPLELGPFSVLASAFPSASAEAAPAEKGEKPPAPSPLKPIQGFMDSLKLLEGELNQARQWSKESDRPETIEQLGLAVSARPSGYSRAQNLIAGLSDRPNHFNSKELSKDLIVLGNLGAAAAGNDTFLKNIVQAFKAYATRMLEARDAIQDAFKADPEIAVCGAVGDGTTTLSLSIKPRPGGFAAAREHDGAIDFEIVIAPPYRRNGVEVVPIAFVTFASNVPRFEVVNDTLRGPRDDATAFRVGALLQINLASFGASDELGVGVGLGLGSRGSDQLISDVFVGPVLSYRDAIRIGLGVGGSQFPASVKKGTVDHPFPSDAGKLDGLIEQRMRRAYQVIVLFPGIKF